MQEDKYEDLPTAKLIIVSQTKETILEMSKALLLDEDTNKNLNVLELEIFNPLDRQEPLATISISKNDIDYLISYLQSFKNK